MSAADGAESASTESTAEAPAASARSDLIGGAAWAAFGLAIVGEALRMDRFTSMGASLYTMPGLVPGIFGAVLVLLGGVMLLRGWRRSRLGAPPPVETPRVSHRRMWLMLGLTLGYAIGLVGRVPFALATFVFLALFMALFSPAEHTGARRIGVAVLTAAAMTAVTVLVFQHVFLVRLP